MKVYLLVWSMPYEGEEVQAVYSDAAKAQGVADSLMNKMLPRSRMSGENYEVREMELISEI